VTHDEEAGIERDELARWRTAFTTAPRRGEARVDPGRIWSAVHGELPPEETAALAAEMAGDPGLAAEWSLAVKARDALAQVADDERRGPRRRVWAGAALASFAAAAAALLWWRPAPDGPAVYRDGDRQTWGHSPAEVTSLGEPVLRWTATDGARRYRVRLMTAALEVVEERETSEPALELPAAARERLAPMFAWQVEAFAADGAMLSRSPTLRARWPR
jgi:hypothetical protein